MNNAIRKYYGKLPDDMLKDMDGMLLKLKRLNRGLLSRKTIKSSEIRPLGAEEYCRLWGYIRHCCSMVTSWPNIRKALLVIADKSGRSFDDVKDECIDSMTIHVYLYSWRKYRHSEDCAYVFTTAEFGYKSWITRQNEYNAGTEAAETILCMDNPSCGWKVSQLHESS